MQHGLLHLQRSLAEQELLFLVKMEATVNTGVAGISIDATGVLRVMQVDPKLAAMQRQAALQSKPRNELKTSPMRMVSLNRLESYVKKQLESGAALSDEVLSLAGLQRLEYVFYLQKAKTSLSQALQINGIWTIAIVWLALPTAKRLFVWTIWSLRYERSHRVKVQPL